MEKQGKKGLGCLSVLGLMLLTIIISVGITVWVVNYYLFPKQFDPVELNAKEESVLEKKLNSFGVFGAVKKVESEKNATILKPEPYSEKGADRQVDLTEKDLNALLAKNTNLAERLMIDDTWSSLQVDEKNALKPFYEKLGQEYDYNQLRCIQADLLRAEQ